MKTIFRLVFLGALLIPLQVNSQEGNYSSITFKNSVWSSSSYIGDLSDWVYFGDGKATVLEYRAPESSFSFTAAIRKAEDGGLSHSLVPLRLVAHSLKLKQAVQKGSYLIRIKPCL